MLIGSQGRQYVSVCLLAHTGSSACVNYLYEPHMKVMATFEDPSLIVTYDATSRSHAVWLLRKAETEVQWWQQAQLICSDYSLFVTHTHPA